MISQGGRFGGWSLFVKDGLPACEHGYPGLKHTTLAAAGRLPAGKSMLALGCGSRSRLTVRIPGVAIETQQKVGNNRRARTILRPSAVACPAHSRPSRGGAGVDAGPGDLSPRPFVQPGQRPVQETTRKATVARLRRQMLGTAAALALSSGPAWCADVLVGSAGERLPGKLVSQDAEWIEFDSDLLGRVRVAASRARVEKAVPDAHLASGAPAQPVPAAAPQEPVRSASVDALAAPDAAPDGSQAPVAPSVAGPTRAAWTRQFGLSGKNDRGTRDNPVDEFELNWRVSRTLQPNATFLELAYHYKLDNEVIKDDDWKIRLRHEREFAERRFRAVQYTNNSQVDDDGRRSVRILSAVSGWRLADSERLKFSVAPGYALLRGSDSEFSRFEANGPVLFTSWDWAVYRELRLSGVLTMVAALGQPGDYAAETDMRLDWPITEQLGIALAWDYQRNKLEFDPGYYSRLRWLLTWKP